MSDQQPKGNEIAALIGPVWSEKSTCESLGVASSALASLREAGEILGLVTGDGVTVYPVWQFRRREAMVEVKPNLIPAFRALCGFDAWTVAVLLHTPSPELDGLTPLDWLTARHDPDAVSDLARVVAREWAAGTRPS